MFGVCYNHNYAGAGFGAGLLGFVLLLIGLFLIIFTETERVPVHFVLPQVPVAYYPTPPTHPLPPPSGANPGSERYCPACGAGNLRAAGFCQRCGKPLPG